MESSRFLTKNIDRDSSNWGILALWTSMLREYLWVSLDRLYNTQWVVEEFDMVQMLKYTTNIKLWNSSKKNAWLRMKTWEVSLVFPLPSLVSLNSAHLFLLCWFLPFSKFTLFFHPTFFLWTFYCHWMMEDARHKILTCSLIKPSGLSCCRFGNRGWSYYYLVSRGSHKSFK